MMLAKNQAKFDLLYKAAIIGALFFGLVFIVISGLALYTNISPELFLPFHLFSALWLLCAMVLHIIHRRSKLRKLRTQLTDLVKHNKNPSFCTFDRLIDRFGRLTFQQLIEKFDLEEQQTKEALRQIHISVKDNQQTLYKICHQNNEKIFLIVDVVTNLKVAQL